MFCCEFIGRDPTFFPGIHMILEYNIHKPKAPHGGWGLSNAILYYYDKSSVFVPTH